MANPHALHFELVFETRLSGAVIRKLCAESLDGGDSAEVFMVLGMPYIRGIMYTR